MRALVGALAAADKAGGVAALLHERRQAYRLDGGPAYIQARDDAEDSVSARASWA